MVKFIRHRARLFKIAIVSIFVVTFVNQGIIQYLLQKRKEGLHAINLAGRQRMLSQKLTKMAWKSLFQQRLYSKEMIFLCDQLDQVHGALQLGSERLGLTPISDKKLLDLFQELDEYERQLTGTIRQVKDIKGLERSMFVIDQNETLFLAKMEEIVKHLETFGVRLQNLVWVEIFLAILTVLIQVFLVLFVYAPVFEKFIFQNTKLLKTNRLYSFIMAINQCILHKKEKAELLEGICEVAIEVGQFKMAHIGFLDSHNRLQMSAFKGDEEAAKQILKFVGLDLNDPRLQTIPSGKVLKSGHYFVNNDVIGDPSMEPWKKIFTQYELRSHISLPILVFGKVIGVFSLHSPLKDFFDEDEIALLNEAAEDISLALENWEREKRLIASEEQIHKQDEKYRDTLDNMLEGVQMHDFNWKYIYVNETLAKYSQSKKEELLGRTLMERFPGLENTPLFATLQKCMVTRVADHIETEFALPNGSTAYFELSIQPVPEGIFILSVDITERKRAVKELLKINRLYAFNSAINQSIVQISEERVLLDKACQIATEIGQFTLAWIGLLDVNGKLKVVSVKGEDVLITWRMQYDNIDYQDSTYRQTPTGVALSTGQYAISNLVPNDPTLAPWKEEYAKMGIQSSMALPIKKFGKTIGVIGLMANEGHFFDKEEIVLLEEAAGDISFALEIMEKNLQHEETAELVIKNERRFRGLIEHSSDMKTLSSENGELIYCSPSVTKVLGYQEEDFLYKPASSFIHPENIPHLIENRAHIFQSAGASFKFEYRFLHKEGYWLWCEGSLTNMLHEPSINAFVSNFRDISDKKKYEKQKDFDRNNLSALINNTNDFMWSVGRDFELITSNEPFNSMVYNMIGQTLKRGDNVLSIGFPWDLNLRYKEYYERAFEGETFSVEEYNGGIFEYWSEISFYPIREGEEIIGTACYSRDITAAKLAEQNIKKSEAFNRGILRSLDSHIAVIDQTGSIMAVNDAWTRFGFENGETRLERVAQGSNYFEVCEQAAIQGDTIAMEVVKGMKEVLLENRTSFQYEYPCHSPTQKRWFNLRVRKFDSEKPMIVASHQDISERKLAEERLIYKNEELEKTNRELDRFVYSASHDLRSPLTSILGLVNLIQEKSREEETQQFAKLIRASVQRLDGFIKDILSYSQNNRSAIEVEEIFLQKRVEGVIDSFAQMKEAELIQFDVNIRENFPFYSDARRVTIILANLISNAIKFHRENSENRKVKITGFAFKDHVELRIEDNGIGIPAKYHTKIYEMFFRLAGRMAGPGIGLYVVKETVERLEGNIRLETVEDKGTTFIVTLKNLKGE